MVYNYNDNRLVLKCKNGIMYDLELRDNITIITGDSGVGKTFLFDKLSSMHKDSILSSSVDNIVMFDIRDVQSWKDEEKLVVIDRADMLLDRKLRYSLCEFKKLRFLVFSRADVSYRCSPNHYGEFVKIGNIISIYYKYNVKGWH